MSDTHNKMQYENKYNHWKMLHLVLKPEASVVSACLICRISFCAYVHGVKSEFSQVRNFAWGQDRSHFSILGVTGVCVVIS